MHQRHPDTETSPPVTVKEDTAIRTDVRTIIVVMGAVVAGLIAWRDMKADIADHGRQLATIQTTLGADHDLLTGMAATLRESHQSGKPVTLHADGGR